MKVCDFRSSERLQSSVLTIGNFDGVHLGHRELITHLVSTASQRQLPSVIYSFTPHPAVVVGGRGEHLRISSEVDNEKIMDQLGVDVVYYENFTKQFAQLSATEFLENYVFKRWGPKKIIFGYDFKFGASKASGVSEVRDFLQSKGCEIEVCPPFYLNDDVVSSSLIREEIGQGRVERTNALLGRPLSLSGVLVSGKGLGKTIKVPTMNLKPHGDMFLQPGVYVSKVRVGAQIFPSVTNIGVNPTVESSSHIKIETHILDSVPNYDEGQIFELFFLKRLRGERKFESIDALVNQIKEDCKMAKQYLKRQDEVGLSI